MAVLKRVVGAGTLALAIVTFCPYVGAAAPRPVTAASATAKNLVLAAPEVVELVNADAAFKRLPDDDFIGLSSAYYAYDSATSTYWAAGRVVPSPSAYRALVSSQDDGGYSVFHRAVHGGWVATDDGMAGAAGSSCAAYHVSIPAAVLAAWNWPAGHCTPTNFGTGPVLLTYLAKARDAWTAGGTAVSAEQASYWLRAANDLKAALVAKAPSTAGFSKAAGQLGQLAKIPENMLTRAQQGQVAALTTALNSFFGTDGLYGFSAPSTTKRAFVATLDQEANLGTLGSNVVADPRLGTLPASFPQPSISCPVLSGVSAGSVFGCKLKTFDTYYLVGTVKSADARTYLAYMVKGAPKFECKADGLSLGEQSAAKKLGGGCAP